MAEEKENTIIINNGGYNGSIMEYSIGCVTSISIAPEKDWVHFILPPDKDDNVVKMQVSENKTGSQREQTFTVSYSIKGQAEACTKSFTIVQKAKVDPCGMFIVDGGEENVDAQGKHKEGGRYPCDSMLLLYSEQPEAHFDPAEASDWVDIEFVSWGDTAKTKDYNNYCTVYTDNPCVADYLLYQAGVVPEHMTCDSSTPLANFPQVVQDAVTGSTQYTNALGTIWYKVKPNTGAKRDFTISWTVGGKDCPPSKNLIIHQDAGSGPTPTCTCNDLNPTGKTISYEPKDSVQIGSYSVNCITNISATTLFEWVTILSVNNGKILAKVTENESTESPRTASITVTGKAGSDTCTKTFNLIQNKKVTACTTCDNVNIQNLNPKTVEASGSASEAIEIGSFSFDCYPDAGFKAKKTEGEGDFVSDITITKDETANECKIYGVVAASTFTSEKTEKIGVFIGDSTSACESYTITQKGVTPTTCVCSSMTLSDTAFTIDCDGTPIVIGEITSGCNIKTGGLPEWAKVYKDENTNKIMFSASTYTDIDMRGGGTSIGIEGKDGYCSPISLVQDGQLTTYDVTIYCTYELGLNGVTPYVRCNGLPEPGSKYFKLTNSAVNMSYDNCKGTSASPQNWPSGREIKYCQPGQGSDEDINRGSIPTTNVVASTIEYGTTSDVQTKAVDSNMGSTVVKYHNFTYNVTIKRNL